jgi:hypothetical protein
MSPVHSITYVSGLDPVVMAGASGFEPRRLEFDRNQFGTRRGNDADLCPAEGTLSRTPGELADEILRAAEKKFDSTAPTWPTDPCNRREPTTGFGF